MKQDLVNKLNELGISLMYGDLDDTNGVFLVKANLIIIKKGLTEDEEDFAIRHELAHFEKHKDNIVGYKTSFQERSKMECEANRTAIGEILDYQSKVCEDEEVDYVNLDYAIDLYGLHMGEEEWFLQQYRNAFS